ncbi:sorbosone dehydrogenase family protein [Salinibacterium sp. ZJ70]|uniref:PQQ-dependent sugar dehydrogenase n=1 Tax=Salinibacterium sp. ZJ70 TaxID=2708084 RepID=UPI00141DF4F9|nr:PQQ-dependent sugar dehydrogenase [Salinibacterium sp. ZJ70]
MSARILAGTATVAALLGGCTAPAPEPVPRSTLAPADEARGPVQPAGDPTTIAVGLTTPWSILPLPEVAGEALVSERDTGTIQRIHADGSLSVTGTVPGVAAEGEGGLLGIALLDADADRWLYAFLTTETDNRIIRMPLGADYTFGEPQEILTGLPRAGNHNGGRIAFGPDGMLYATTGDAGEPQRAQDPASLGGKILRMTPDGAVPDDNPFPGSLVYSLGHRNPQGLAWDDEGRLWASEFGQSTWDEVNRIHPGANYGWPEVEGDGDIPGFVDPAATWPTDDASPSGLAFIDGTLFMAALRGERLWALYPLPDGRLDAVSWFEGDFGRIRDVVPAADGSLWFVTNNTDGRGSPQVGDDRLLSVHLVELQEG